MASVALTWFEKYAHPKGLIEYLELDPTQRPYMLYGLKEYKRLMYIGYSYLYLSEYNSGAQYLQGVVEAIESSRYPDHLARDEALLSLQLIQEDADRIPQMLRSNVDKMRVI